jgi:hypothetical protein
MVDCGNPSFPVIIFVFWITRFLLCGGVERNRIVTENLKTGSDVWWYSQAESPDTHMYGYTTKMSYKENETIAFKLISLKKVTVTIQLWIFRLGYYGGKGARLVGNVSFPSELAYSQPPCMLEPVSRLVDCSNWKTSVRWKIPSFSVSGVYVALPVVMRNTRNFPGGKVPTTIDMTAL